MPDVPEVERDRGAPDGSPLPRFRRGSDAVVPVAATMSVRPLWPIVRQMPIRYRFHDGEFRLSWRQTVRLHWTANVRMLGRVAPTAVFIGVSVVPVALWIAPAIAIARLLPVEPGSWTILDDRFLDALIVGVLPYLLLQHVAFMVALEATYSPIVREVLREMGFPICPACGQQVDAAEMSRRCPECGHDPGGRAARPVVDRGTAASARA